MDAIEITESVLGIKEGQLRSCYETDNPFDAFRTQFWFAIKTYLESRGYRSIVGSPYCVHRQQNTDDKCKNCDDHIACILGSEIIRVITGFTLAFFLREDLDEFHQDMLQATIDTIFTSAEKSEAKNYEVH